MVTGMYGVNKEMSFGSKEKYASYMKKKSNIALDDFYYVDQKTYRGFGHAVANSNTSYFMGLFINDTTMVKKSGYLEEMQGCYGRVTGDITNYEAAPDSAVLENNKLFSTHKFINVSDGSSLRTIESGKKRIVLVLSYKNASLMKSEFRKFKSFLDSQKGYELIIVSMDPVYGYASN